MWILTNKGALSAVEHRDDKGKLMVRARRREHLEAFLVGFGFAGEIEHTPRADYAYRTTMKRMQFNLAVMRQIGFIDYDNFKNSVADDDLHAAYSQVWSTLLRLQSGGKYAPYDWGDYAQDEGLDDDLDPEYMDAVAREYGIDPYDTSGEDL